MHLLRLHLALPCLLLLAACELPDPVPPANPCEPNPCTQSLRSVCVAEDGNARCLCDPGTLPRPSGVCEAIGGGNCPEHAGDVDEPNDCFVRAADFPPTGSAEPARSIDPVGDVDFYRFEADRNDLYEITVEPLAGALMPRIDAFDQGGLHVALAEATGKTSLLFKAPATAPFFVRVAHSPRDPSWATGEYTVRLRSLGREDHGDSAAEATTIVPDPVGTTSPAIFRGTFEYPADTDWFAFSGTRTQRYHLHFNPDRAQPVVWIRAANGQVRELGAEETSFELPADGTTHLQLFPLTSDPAGPSYDFQFLRQPL